MTVTLILAGGLVAFAVFIAGCFVGHRTGRQEGSDSAMRWTTHYEKSKYGAGCIHPNKPADPATMRNMAAAHMLREGWDD